MNFTLQRLIVVVSILFAISCVEGLVLSPATTRLDSIAARGRQYAEIDGASVYQVDFTPEATGSDWGRFHGYHEEFCEIRILDLLTGSFRSIGRVNITPIGKVIRFVGDAAHERIFIEDQDYVNHEYGWWILDVKSRQLVKRFPYTSKEMEVSPMLVTPDGRKILLGVCEKAESPYVCKKNAAYIIDGISYDSIAKIDNLVLYGSLGHGIYFSEDSGAVYTCANDLIEAFDLSKLSMVERISTSKIAGSSVYVDDIKQGKALLAHFDYGPGTPPTIRATQLMLLNLRDKTIQSSVRYPFYAEDASLSPDARYVIAFEMPEKVGKRAIREGEPISPAIHIFTVASQEKTSLSLTIAAPAAMSIPSTRLAIKPLAYDPTNRVMKLEVENDLVTLNLEKRSIDGKVSHPALGLTYTKRKKMEK